MNTIKSTPRILTLLLAMVAVAVAGCQTPEGYSRHKMSRMICTRTASHAPAAPVTAEYVCDLPDGTKVTLPAGIYRVLGTDADGTFWQLTKGIVLSSKGDKRTKGGIYLPADPESPCLIWVEYKAGYYVFSDPAWSGPEMYDSSGSARWVRASYVGDVPDAVALELKAAIEAGS